MGNSDFVLIDKEVVLSKYFAEDDCVRSIGKYPEYVGTMMICVDSFDNGLASGRLHTYFYEKSIHFFSLDQLLFAMEDIMDETGITQPWTEKRTFEKVKRRRKKTTSEVVIVQDIAPFYDLQTVQPPKGRVASFYVRVYSRMNSSMQGVVMTLGSSNKVAFRSELELLYLIREKLSLPQKTPHKIDTF